MISRRLRVTGTGSLSGPVAAFVSRVAGLAGLTRQEAYRLRLAVDEITTNVVQHGYRGPGGVVDLAGGIDGDRVWVRIEDDAPAFDPRCHEPPAGPLPEPHLRREGGYGLMLATRSVDEFTYEHTGGRNRNTLVIKRASGRMGRVGEGSDRWPEARR